MAPQRRKAISTAQRRALRQHARTHPQLSQRHLIAWFEDEFKQLITQPSVSESLSPRFAFLDHSDTRPDTSLRQRSRQSRWPQLEDALYQWFLRYEQQGPITEALIREQAARFWKRLPHTADMELPVFSNGWVQRFKTRYQISSRRAHGEAASVDIASIHEQLAAVQAIARQYQPADCYNCDETGLFYKSVPERSLSTSNHSGIKNDKSRITLHFCCNADGSDKLPIWFIGKSANPRCFSAANISISALNAVWKSNRKAWMTSQLMVEWLQWFQRRIGSRRVLLIMDNFSAHTLAVETLRQTEPLHNINIVWLPPNSTSITQPLDQGIIAAFKAHFRKRWLLYMLNEFDAGRLPLKTMNVLKAVRWSVQAWQSVTPQTLRRCWYHSTLIKQPEELENEADETTAQATAEAYASLRQLEADQRISRAMAINTFLNPIEEAVRDTDEDLCEQIALQFDPPEADDSDAEELLPKVSHSQAVDSLNQLRLYEEQQLDGRHQLIEQLDAFETVIKERQTAALYQADLTHYFQPIGNPIGN